MNVRAMFVASVVIGLWIVGCTQPSNVPASAGVLLASSVNRPSTAIIHSQADLNKYLEATSISQSPLGFLSAGAQSRFLGSLKFNDKGVTTFRYDDLVGLSSSKVYKILSLFGLQDDTSMIAHLGASAIQAVRPAVVATNCPASGCDYPGYACAMHGTCTKASDSICTHNC